MVANRHTIDLTLGQLYVGSNIFRRFGVNRLGLYLSGAPAGPCLVVYGMAVLVTTSVELANGLSTEFARLLCIVLPTGVGAEHTLGH